MKALQKNLLTILFLLVIGTGYVLAQDWPQWQGVNRDGKVTGFTTPDVWPAELTMQWSVRVGFGDATPALSGNRLYLFTRQDNQETLLCLDAKDGKEVWKNGYVAREVTGPAASHPGPRSTPTVANGKVYTLGVGGVVSCFNASTGDLIWQDTTHTGEVPSFFTAMSPLVTNGLCITHLGGKETGKVVAFNEETGNIQWETPVNNPTYASPKLINVNGKNHMVLQAENELMGLSLENGAVLWKVSTPIMRRFYSSASPIISGDRIYHTGHGDGIKALQIKQEGKSFTADELWMNVDYWTAFNTPVLRDGFLYGLSDKGKLFCVNTTHGESAWADTTMHKNFGAVVDAGKVMMALPSTSNLVVFKPDGKTFNELAIYKVAESPVYAHPVLSGNRIYIKDEEHLTLWTLE